MNILSISSILPIPGTFKYNDFVFQTYKYHYQLYKDDKVVIIKPAKYDFNVGRIIKGATKLIKLKKNYSLSIDGFQVEIFPFLSSVGYRNMHAFLTRSIYFLNKKRIEKLFSEYKFDVIHAQYIFPDGLLAYMLSKRYIIPYFVTTHNERCYFDHVLSRQIGLKILQNAKRVLAINHTNYLYYKTLGVENIELLPLGFNQNFLHEQKSPGSDVISIFTVSELIKLKNIDKVLLALKALPAGLRFKYTIIGEGDEKQFLINLTATLGLADQVIFIDHIPHERIADEMYKHDIFIMPSYFETFGRVYFEVMAMGIPIICAKNSGIHGLFIEREEGISVDHNNIQAMADALEFLIINPEVRIRIGINGQKLVQNFTWENIVHKLHDYYTSSS